MKGRNPHDVFDLTLSLAQRLFTGGLVTTHYIREEFGVSVATAKRYMTRLECSLPVLVEDIPAESIKSSGQCRKQMRLLKTPLI